jgi:TonB family protein
MKSTLLSGLGFCAFALLFISFVSHNNKTYVVKSTSFVFTQMDDTNKTYSITETMPEFPGGIQAMAKFIQSNIVYPDSARSKGISGKCFLKFVVDTAGTVTKVEVIKGVPNCPECDEEAARVVRAMPSWTPGTIKGRPVNCFYNLPIVFRSQ